MKDRSLDGLRAVHVDDDPRVRKMVRLMLNSLGFKVNSFGDSSKASDVINKRLETSKMPIDVLIVDGSMPVMNGGELAQGVRAKNPTLPIVLLSSEVGHYLPRYPTAFNSNTHKPVSRSGLKTAITEAQSNASNL